MISPYALVRKILGRKGTFLLRSIVSSISYGLGIYEYADSTGRDEGISAMVCSYNEEDWVEPSLLSIKDLVDEYIVVDSSTDRTPLIINEIKREYGLNIKMIRTPPSSLSEIRKIALSNASCKWILHWDPDFIAYDNTPEFLKELISNLDKKRHYLIYWKHLVFCGDLKHLCNRIYHVEHWLFTYSKTLTYRDLRVRRDKVTDVLIAPARLYKPIFIDRVLSVHIAWVRNPERLAVKYLWYKYREDFNELVKQGYRFEEVAIKYAEKTYGTSDLKTVGLRIMSEMTRDLPEYREELYGPLPRVLIEYLNKKEKTLIPNY